MQLRVARLCLDCEELHAGSSCPVCASQRFAFLSTWLPSEERRRWRRPAPRSDRQHAGPLRAFGRRVASWFSADDSEPLRGQLRTRASDAVPSLNFDDRRDEPARRPTPTSHPLKDDG